MGGLAVFDAKEEPWDLVFGEGVEGVVFHIEECSSNGSILIE